MKTYAVLNNDSQVINVIIASSLEVAESVTSHNCAFVPLGKSAGIGYSYIDGEFVNPNAPENPAEETPA
jgi:hypothetical protein